MTVYPRCPGRDEARFAWYREAAIDPMLRRAIRAQACLPCPVRCQVGWHHRRAVLQILLVLAEITRRGRIGVDRALLIPKFSGIYDIAGAILQLIVDVVGACFDICALDPSVAHRADQLACDNWIAHRDMPRMRMQDFVEKAICIPDSYSPNGTLPGILHDAGHGRAYSRVRQIDALLPIRPNVIVEIDAAMRFVEPGGLFVAPNALVS